MNPPEPNAMDASLERRICMLRTAMGPEIAAALEDPEVVEVLLNPDGSLWLDRLDRLGTGRDATGAGRGRTDHPAGGRTRARRGACGRADPVGRAARDRRTLPGCAAARRARAVLHHDARPVRGRRRDDRGPGRVSAPRGT